MINVGGKKVYLHFDWQVGSRGEKFRLSSTLRGNQTSWIPRSGKKVPMNDWYYTFKYESGDMFTFHVDPVGKVIKKLDNEKTLELFELAEEL